MTPTKEPTAQDFFDAIIAKHEGSEFFIHEDDERKTVEAFNELLSQVRHEAIAEWESVNLNKKIQQAFSAGRLQGLKEMDEANKRIWDEKSTDSIVAMEDLRSEYQKPN